jgi:hypothetical protein
MKLLLYDIGVYGHSISRGARTYRIVEPVVGSLRLNFVLLAEGSIADPCYNISH